MSPSLTTFLFELINFLVLALVLGRVFFNPVRRALEDRRAKVAAQLGEAAQKLAEAERAGAQLVDRQRQFDAELEQRRGQMEKAAQQSAADILARARAKAQQERDALGAEFEASRRTEARQLAHSAALAAGQIVAKLLAEIEGPALQESLERAACRQLAAISSQLVPPLKVESQDVLPDDTQNLIRSISQKSENDVEFRVLPQLGAGVRITTNQGMIDATVTGLATFAEQALHRELEAATS